MADECELMWETSVPIPFTVADGTAITKGANLQLSDPFTAIAPAATNAMVAGVAWGDKVASSGITKLSLYRSGIFKVTFSGSVTAGDPLALVIGSNRLVSAVGTLTLSGSRIWGVSFESATDGQTGLAELRPGFGFVAV